MKLDYHDIFTKILGHISMIYHNIEVIIIKPLSFLKLQAMKVSHKSSVKDDSINMYTVMIAHPQPFGVNKKYNIIDKKFQSRMNQEKKFYRELLRYSMQYSGTPI